MAENVNVCSKCVYDPFLVEQIQFKGRIVAYGLYNSTRTCWPLREVVLYVEGALDKHVCVGTHRGDAGYRIAGLSGTFEAQVWLPSSPDTRIQNYQKFLNRLAFTPQHADIVATKKQHALSAIYPDDYFALAMKQADILVCHEAPSCHPYGYAEIDEIVHAMGVKMVIHGHHHDCLDYRSEWPRLGFEAHGVAFRSIMSIEGSVIS